jgi:hypothetical protein
MTARKDCPHCGLNLSTKQVADHLEDFPDPSVWPINAPSKPAEPEEEIGIDSPQGFDDEVRVSNSRCSFF